MEPQSNSNAWRQAEYIREPFFALASTDHLDDLHPCTHGTVVVSRVLHMESFRIEIEQL